ncbi:MAG: NIPSNAP family protein [Rhizomicrobium sp.]
MNRRDVMHLSLLVAAGALSPSALAAATAKDMTVDDHSHDFDFFFGDWKVRHRYLKARLAGSTEWLEFDGTTKTQPLLGGLGNVDDNVLDKPGDPYRAVTVRAFDPKTNSWAIWWVDSRTPTAPLDPPMLGQFENGVGTFFSDQTFNDKPIKVRFLWMPKGPDAAQWEQAFSPDGGRTWETNWVMQFSRAHRPVIELRQYTLHPGKRDVLIDLFEREFVESQESLGMFLPGMFRDANNPDRFVWLREFPDMAARPRMLGDFYYGPVWKAHRNEANPTMVDSDNVLLLKPAWSGADFARYTERAPVGATGSTKGLVLAQIHYFGAAVPDGFVSAWSEIMPARIAAGSGKLLSACVTEAAENNFPRLPIREGENVFISFTLFDSTDAKPVALPSELAKQVKATETLRLIPTARSRIHA